MLIYTHNGRFHCDEVCAVAMLLQLYPTALVVRTRDLERLDGKNPEDVVVDVGGKFVPEENRFDHHQKTFDLTFFPDPEPSPESKLEPPPGLEPKEVEHHPARIPMSSAGLVWKYYGHALLKKYPQWFELDAEEKETMFKKLYASVFRQIDAHDNGIQPHENVVGYNYYVSLTLGTTIGKMNSLEHTNDELQMERFRKATAYAWITLDTFIVATLDRYLQLRPSYRQILPLLVARARSEILVLPEEIPLYEDCVLMWEQDTSHSKEIMFIVHPKKTEKKSQWNISTLPDPDSKNFFDRRYYLLPEDQLADQLKEAGEDVIFVHKNRFCGAATTQGTAIRMCELSLVKE